MTSVILYGLGGADQSYRVVRYDLINIDELLGTRFGVVETVKYEAQMMKIKYPNIERVFMVDNGRNLLRDYKEALKKNSIESHAIFKDILERRGIDLTQYI